MLEQIRLFDLPEPPVQRERVRTFRRKSDADRKEDIPEQIAIRLKWARKIAFKRRFREDPNSTNDHVWTLEAIARLHLELFEDWFNKFPALELRSEQLDYWTWMLADTNEPFSFRDVLVMAGYTHPDSFIEMVVLQTPDWVRDEIRKKSTANAEIKSKAKPSNMTEKHHV
ncbi:hypothetical protein [Luteimonas sp. MHLX1A]|uniref:hypothetical protein n=1 Tax=Alterluteimonas muca TaxID=2878684 RepID=UPI001E405AF9|nr:hypothetical protein [Luteimonas sp. MHLX1A]MCD9046919.1 hypothetical protein [Luteimonas sp. MHLX1A]